MSQVQYVRPVVARTAESWSRLEELMRSTSRDFSGATVSGVAPSVQGAAKAFLDAWTGYAEESAAVARGCSTSLEAFAADMGTADQSSGEHFADLDSRLGPRS